MSDTERLVQEALRVEKVAHDEILRKSGLMPEDIRPAADSLESPEMRLVLPADILFSLCNDYFHDRVTNWPERSVESLPDSGSIIGYRPGGVMDLALFWWKANGGIRSTIVPSYLISRHLVKKDGSISNALTKNNFSRWFKAEHLVTFLNLVNSGEIPFKLDDSQEIPVLSWELPEGVSPKELDKLPPFHMSPRSLPSYMERMKGHMDIPRRTEDSIWWVSEDMSALAWDTVLSGTEPEDWEAEELPAGVGLMYFDGQNGLPLPSVPLYGPEAGTVQYTTISAVLWEDTHAAESEYGPVGYYPIAAKTGAFAGFPDTANTPLSNQHMAGELWNLHHLPGYSNEVVMRELPEKLVKVALRLSRESTLGEQEIKEIEPPSKAERKKRQKEGRKPDTVVLSVLRRPKTQPKEDLVDSQGREYSHRWIVRGHNRKQPYGQKDEDGNRKYKAIWIAPYVKGPIDKPLIIKDKVNVWKR